jgi:hypothetical protein
VNTEMVEENEAFKPFNPHLILVAFGYRNTLPELTI